MKFNAYLIPIVLLIATYSTILRAGGMDPDQAAQHLADRMTSKKEGDVGKVSGETLYIALGEQDGILAGSQFDIVRLGEPILVGGRQIGREEKVVAKAEAKRVRAQMTVAHQIAMLEPPRAGDKAYLTSTAVKRLVVAPLLYNNAVTGLSRSLQEKLITALLNKGMPVVERSQLERVLSEQKLGYSGLVALDSAKKLGKLLGADAMVLGTLTDQGDTIDVNARLVELASGTALCGEKANIAKTPGVSELLHQKLDNGLEGHLGVSHSDHPKLKFPFYEDDVFRMDILNVVRESGTIILQMRYLNKSKDVALLLLNDPQKYAFLSDSMGTQLQFKEADPLVGKKRTEFPPGIARRGYITFRDKQGVGTMVNLSAHYIQHGTGVYSSSDFIVLLRNIKLP